MNTQDYKIGDDVYFIYKNKAEKAVVCGWAKSEEVENHMTYNPKNVIDRTKRYCDTITVLHEDCKEDGLTLQRKDCYPTKELLLASL